MFPQQRVVKAMTRCRRVLRRRGRRPPIPFQAPVTRRVNRHPTSPLAKIPTPAIHRMCQKPATTPTKAPVCATTCAMATRTDLALRRRKASCRLTITRAASSGMATEKATTQILADRSSDAAVRNGCTMTRRSRSTRCRSGCSAGAIPVPAAGPVGAMPGPARRLLHGHHPLRRGCRGAHGLARTSGRVASGRRRASAHARWVPEEGSNPSPARFAARGLGVNAS
jgi:hypothetical protein